MASVSLLKKLHARELTGRLSFRKADPPWKLFTKIPNRMCYRLKYLVPSCILEDGYVFLGFSKSGQYVISYSLQIDADEHSACPDHIYHLQWWLFIPLRPLLLVSEVRIFGEENIPHSLYIAYCEWPEDRTKIAIYGHSPIHSGEDGCQCYLTVTAVPSYGQCHDCISHKRVTPQVPSIEQCLRHSFCVHSKFELAPPFPNFIPWVQLSVDGIIVLNTGDSIVALQVDTQLPLNSFDTEGRLAMEQDDIHSKNILGADLSILGTVSTYFTEHEDPTKDLSPKNPNLLDSPAFYEGDDENFYSADISELSDTDQSESKSTKSSSDRPRFQCEKCSSFLINNANSTPNTNSNSRAVGSNNTGLCSACSVISNHRPALRTKNMTNAVNESTTPSGGRTGGPPSHFHPNECLSPKSPRSPKSSGLNDLASRVSQLYNQSSNSLSLGLVANGVGLVTGGSGGGGCGGSGGGLGLVGDAPPSDSIMSPPPPVPQSPNVEVGSNRSQTDPEDNLSFRLPSHHRSFFSPSSSAASDCQSQSSESVIVHTTHTRTVTFSVRRFSTDNQEADDPEVQNEDDYDLAYKSILPVTVVWDKTPLNIIRTARSDMSLITVLQMTFDIEHYMVDAIRHDAYWGQRYVAFCNYDLQILNVCSSSQSVYGIVYALIQAKDTQERVKFSRITVKLYETRFTFSFNLCTGLYTTLFIEPLTEVDEKILRGRDWNSPGSKECAMLRRKVAVPPSKYSSVYALTNVSVMNERSLTRFSAPHQFIHILL